MKRFIGVLRSIVLFDGEPVVENGGGVLRLTEGWRETALSLADFTNTDPAVNRYRFCTYIPEPGEEGCAKCISYCPSGALANSSPKTDGKYSEEVARQQHRFWDGALQFDNGRCCDERGQMANLYSEWMCGRCVSICGGEGKTRRYAAERFEELLGA